MADWSSRQAHVRSHTSRRSLAGRSIIARSAVRLSSVHPSCHSRLTSVALGAAFHRSSGLGTTCRLLTSNKLKLELSISLRQTHSFHQVSKARVVTQGIHKWVNL